LIRRTRRLVAQAKHGLTELIHWPEAPAPARAGLLRTDDPASLDNIASRTQFGALANVQLRRCQQLNHITRPAGPAFPSARLLRRRLCRWTSPAGP